MLSPRSTPGALAAWLVLVLLLAEFAWAGPLRISNLAVTNSEKTLLVAMVLLGSLPDGVVEGLGAGIPATLRYPVELWQYDRWWLNRRIAAKILERQVVYDVLTKEYRVSAMQGEEREPYVTRDIWEAERVMSEVRTLPLVPIGSLSGQELYYVRARADLRSGVPDSSLSKIVPLWTSRVETEWEQSPLLTINRAR